MELCTIVCSPRIDGNTSYLANVTSKHAARFGANLKMFYFHDLKIEPCKGCRSCWTNDKCCIDDDMQLLYSAMLHADAILLASPVYFWSVTAQAKMVIDRSYALYSKMLLNNKTVGLITVAARRGNTNAINTMTNFAILHQMTIAGCVTAYGKEKEDVQNDASAISEAESLGKKLALI